MKPSEIHLTHAARGKGWRVDVGPATVRIDGADPDLKREIALRIAVCWNAMEGIPTQRILDGVITDYDKAVDALFETVANKRHAADHEGALATIAAAADGVRAAIERLERARERVECTCRDEPEIDPDQHRRDNPD